jgi:hypothetical protein
VDIIKFNNDPSTPTLMEHAEIINGITNKLWIERYLEVGEFKFISPVSSGLREKLPIGSYISHKDTKEIMIVEDHEINEEQGQESKITITGRGLESWLETRVFGANFQPFLDNTHETIGSHKNYPAPGVPDAKLAKDYTWSQAINVFQEHVTLANLIDNNDGFPYWDVVSITAGGRQAYRKIQRGDSVLKIMQFLLSIQKLGMRIQRPSTLNILTTLDHTVLVIHSGFDRTKQVSFSYDGGEILDADYFWSNRDYRNFAYISSKWVETWVDIETVSVGLRPAYDKRRWLYVDGSDIDKDMDTEPTDAVDLTLTHLVNDLLDRGRDELDLHNNTNLTKVNAAHQAQDSQYRVDFNCGDLVTVIGHYNDKLTMRVTEFAEIEDENGEQGYPTLVVEDT